jgi:uncharacterized protein (TIGR03435 family)
VTTAQMLAMLRTLLTERFKLKVHRERKQMLGLALPVSPNGSKLKEASGDGPPSFAAAPVVKGQRVPVATIVNFLAERLGRAVVDKTGLTGRYDFSLAWTPDPTELGPNGAPITTPALDQSGASLTTAAGAARSAARAANRTS